MWKVHFSRSSDDFSLLCAAYYVNYVTIFVLWFSHLIEHIAMPKNQSKELFLVSKKS